MENSYYRVMALDYGDVRIGVALSDVTRFWLRDMRTILELT